MDLDHWWHLRALALRIDYRVHRDCSPLCHGFEPSLLLLMQECQSLHSFLSRSLDMTRLRALSRVSEGEEMDEMRWWFQKDTYASSVVGHSFKPKLPRANHFQPLKRRLLYISRAHGNAGRPLAVQICLPLIFYYRGNKIALEDKFWKSY